MNARLSHAPPCGFAQSVSSHRVTRPTSLSPTRGNVLYSLAYLAREPYALTPEKRMLTASHVTLGTFQRGQNSRRVHTKGRATMKVPVLLDELTSDVPDRWNGGGPSDWGEKEAYTFRLDSIGQQ